MVSASKWASLLLACAWLPFQVAAGAEYGVGFNLALEYGTASIYFRNGTIANVGKIDGGAQYKEAMRVAYLETFYPNDDFGHGLDIKGSSRSRGLCDHLPPWLCRRKQSPLLPVLKSLKSAVETYLETDISAAEVIFPFNSWRLSDFPEDVKRSMDSLSLRMPAQIARSAGELAADFPSRGTECDDYKPWTLDLAFEYSRSALTGSILLNWCNHMERRVLHDLSLGADGIDDYRDEERLETALHKFLQLPLGDGHTPGDEIAEFSELYLLGESSDDVKLHNALEKVLQKPHGRSLTGKLHGNTTVDPLFVASAAVAYTCWEYLDYESGGYELR